MSVTSTKRAYYTTSQTSTSVKTSARNRAYDRNDYMESTLVTMRDTMVNKFQERQKAKVSVSSYEESKIVSRQNNKQKSIE